MADQALQNICFKMQIFWRQACPLQLLGRSPAEFRNWWRQVVMHNSKLGNPLLNMPPAPPSCWPQLTAPYPQLSPLPHSYSHRVENLVPRYPKHPSTTAGSWCAIPNTLWPSSAASLCCIFPDQQWNDFVWYPRFVSAKFMWLLKWNAGLGWYVEAILRRHTAISCLVSLEMKFKKSTPSTPFKAILAHISQSHTHNPVCMKWVLHGNGRLFPTVGHWYFPIGWLSLWLQFWLISHSLTHIILFVWNRPLMRITWKRTPGSNSWTLIFSHWMIVTLTSILLWVPAHIPMLKVA